MFSLWVKEFSDEKSIILNKTFTFKQDFKGVYLPAYLQVICNDLKTETPIILKCHINDFLSFNRVKFTRKDFVDKVDFAELTVEMLN